VVAYADVTIFVTQHADFRVIRDAIQLYEKASGARLNVQKSKAIAIGWNKNENDLGVNLVPNIRILGITFSNTIEEATYECWSRIITGVKAQAQHAYGPKLCLSQRVICTQHTSSPYPVCRSNPPAVDDIHTNDDRHIMVRTARNDLSGAPSTLQKPKTQG
jgi:hypothetical protein